MAGDPGRKAEKSPRQAVALANADQRPIDQKREFQRLANASQRVAVALRRSLILADGHAWNGFAAIIRARLTDRERAEIAYSALMALDDEPAMAVATLRSDLCRRAQPLPAFLNLMAEAEAWAIMATDREREAYALACIQQMNPARVAAMMRHHAAQDGRNAA